MINSTGANFEFKAENISELESGAGDKSGIVVAGNNGKVIFTGQSRLNAAGQGISATGANFRLTVEGLSTIEANGDGKNGIDLMGDNSMVTFKGKSTLVAKNQGIHATKKTTVGFTSSSITATNHEAIAFTDDANGSTVTAAEGTAFVGGDGVVASSADNVAMSFSNSTLLATKAGAGRVWVAKAFVDGAMPSASPGRHRATWDAKAEGADNVATEVLATVRLVRCP